MKLLKFIDVSTINNLSSIKKHANIPHMIINVYFIITSENCTQKI